MTHLRIEQNNIQENVSSAVIYKLYELATIGDLDASSHLAGNLYVSATYQEYIDVLTDQTNPKFRDLTITANSIYIMFADSEVKRVMATQFGDGTNVSVSDLTGVTALPNQLFRNNSNISTFNELNNLRGITALGSGCFEGSSIQQIGLNNITTLWGNVFYNARSLTTVSLPNLQSLGSSMFYGCSSLTSVFFNSTVLQVTLPANTFYSCTNLTSVSGLQNITRIESCAFQIALGLTTTDIDSSKLISVGDYAFDRASSLTISGNFQNLTTVGFQAFYRLKFTNGMVTCPSITQNELLGWTFKESNVSTIDFTGSSFTQVNQDAISDCSSLTQVTLPSTCTALERDAFQNCRNLTTINTGNITRLGGNNGGWVFRNCSSLTSLDLSSVTTTTSFVFLGTNISNFVMPSIVSLGQTFTDTSSVRTIDLGENLTSIDAQCFWGSGVTTIIFRGNTPPSFSDPGRDNKFKYDQSNLTVYVPDAKISDYQTALPGVASCITGISNLP